MRNYVERLAHRCPFPFRCVQLSKTEYEISSSKDWKNGIPKTKVNITAQLSLEGNTYKLLINGSFKKSIIFNKKLLNNTYWFISTAIKNHGLLVRFTQEGFTGHTTPHFA